MRPFFITCRYEEVETFDHILVDNYPINLQFCKYIKKTTYDGPTKKNPAIEFVGIDVKWVYYTFEERDEDFDIIIKSIRQLALVDTLFK